MKYTFTFLLALFLCQLAAAQEELPSMYPKDIPIVQNIWHRVGDYSSGLRSVEAAEISPDSKLVVSGAKFGYAVILWRAADGTIIWEKAHDSEVECVTFSPDGNRIATGGEDYFVRIWDTEDGNIIRSIEHPGALDGIAWSNNGEILAAGTEGGDLYLWNTDDFTLLGKVNVGSTINSIQFNQADDKVLVAGNVKTPDPETGERITTGFATLLQVNDLETLVQYEGAEASVKSIRMTSDEKYVATGCFDNRVRVFDFNTGELIKTFHEPYRVEAVAFTPDGHFLLSGGHDRVIRFYRMSDLDLVHTIPTPRTEYIDFSDDGRLMLTAHEDSGLLSLYMMISVTNKIPGLYQKMSQIQLNNRDMQ